MRQDEEIHKLIQEKRAKERESGCCVRNDRSGCLQTLQEECSVSDCDCAISLVLYRKHKNRMMSTMISLPPSTCLLLQSTLAVWVKWPGHPSVASLNGTVRQHGSVCHQDPRWRINAGCWHAHVDTSQTPFYSTCGLCCWGSAALIEDGDVHCCSFCRICLEPASVSPHEWPDDITKWPVSTLTCI